MAKKGLGRGLGALIGELNEPQVSANNEKQVLELNINEVERNSKQPRTDFDEDKLRALAESVEKYGVIQPILVKKQENGFYQIIAGERRWRASKLAGLKTIPAIVKEYEELKSIEVALIENLQREDLNPIEEALGYKNLMVQFSMTQEQISESVGKSRSAVANSLRLLSLDEELLALVREKELSEGHARALLGISDREKRLFLASKIVEEGLSVRQTEALVKKYNTEPKEEVSPSEELSTQAQLAIEDICGRLQSSLATKVKITSGKKKGKIEIEYYGNDDLERIVSLINQKSIH
jgi:ParB family chromosome partitioning protein